MWWFDTFLDWRRPTQLVSSAPEIDSKPECNDRQNRTEFVNKPSCLSGVASKWSKNGLNVEIVARVKYGRGPETSRFQPHPREYKRDGQNEDGEAGQAVPRGRSVVVIPPD
jgi:hypothetical protein